MRVLKLKREIAPRDIKAKMKSAKTISEYKRWQVIYLVRNRSGGAGFIADVTGYSKANVYAVVQKFNNSRKADVSPGKRGGRIRELMSIEEERELMEGMEGRALKGQILTAENVREAVERKVGRAVSDDYIWDLFKRNGWTKHSPRPHHPKRDVEKQKEFKKNSKKAWLPQGTVSDQS